MGDEARMEGVPGLSAPVFLPCRSYAGRRLSQSKVIFKITLLRRLRKRTPAPETKAGPRSRRRLRAASTLRMSILKVNLLWSVFAPLRVGAVTISNGGPAQPAIRRGEDNDGSYLSLRLGGAHGPAQCRKIHAVERPAGPESDHCHAQTPDHAQSDRRHSH